VQVQLSLRPLISFAHEDRAGTEGRGRLSDSEITTYNFKIFTPNLIDCSSSEGPHFPKFDK